MDMLSNTDSTVESVVNEIGHSDAYTFSKSFKKMTGMPPREFRSRDRNESEVEWRVC
ncbi:hypothetical protein BH24ACI3_BH24ACI3_00730 [soil metagenome]